MQCWIVSIWPSGRNQREIRRWHVAIEFRHAILGGWVAVIQFVCFVCPARARWRENRTIFNTPNPRLANASLLNKEALIGKASGHQPGGSRRGSVNRNGGGASRQESLASIPRSLNDAAAGNESIDSSRSRSRLTNPQRHVKNNFFLFTLTHEASQSVDGAD